MWFTWFWIGYNFLWIRVIFMWLCFCVWGFGLPFYDCGLYFIVVVHIVMGVVYILWMWCIFYAQDSLFFGILAIVLWMWCMFYDCGLYCYGCGSYLLMWLIFE